MKSPEALAPYERDIKALSHVVTVLEAKLQDNCPSMREHTSVVAEAIGTEQRLSDLTEKTSVENELAQPHRQTGRTCIGSYVGNDIGRLLRCAEARFVLRRTHVEQLKSCPDFSWFSQNARLSHLQYLLLIGLSQRLRALGLWERLLLLLSYMSLATEPRDFERRDGGFARQDQVIYGLSQGMTILVQEIRKHTKDFLDEVQIRRSKERITDTGLRLGMKPNIINHIGEKHGFGAFLSLSLGFDCCEPFACCKIISLRSTPILAIAFLWSSTSLDYLHYSLEFHDSRCRSHVRSEAKMYTGDSLNLTPS